jgi:hypothetical protein
MVFRSHLKDDDNRVSSSFKARIGSLEDHLPASPSSEKVRRKSKAVNNEPFSPSIRPKDSTADLMFDMDDDDIGSPPTLNSAVELTSASPGGPATPRFPTMSSAPKIAEGGSLTELSASVGLGIEHTYETPKSATKTWSSPNLPMKLDMKEIMAQASTNRTSNLSMSISAQKAKDEADKKASTPKLSQKERKKQQQAFQQAMAETSTDRSKSSSPWQTASPGSRTNLKDLLTPEPKPASPLAAPKATNLPLVSRRTASPDTRFSGQQRSNSSNAVTPQKVASPGPSRPAPQPSSQSSPLVPHSKTYTAPAAKAEPSLQLSMADIIGMQQREQEVIKEAVAKRSLQEIQEEQAFQEWWDQESKRAQEEEASRARASAKETSSRGGKSGSSGGGRGKGGSRGRGGGSGGGRGRGDSTARGGGGAGGGRGRGRGRPQEKPTTAT